MITLRLNAIRNALEDGVTLTWRRRVARSVTAAAGFGASNMLPAFLATIHAFFVPPLHDILCSLCRSVVFGLARAQGGQKWEGRDEVLLHDVLVSKQAPDMCRKQHTPTLNSTTPHSTSMVELPSPSWILWIWRYRNTEHRVVKSPKAKMAMSPNFLRESTLRRSNIGTGRLTTMMSDTMVTTA